MSPLLTIAIPTYNRADFLSLNLNHLEQDLRAIDPTKVEILVSDNASTDSTTDVVLAAGAHYPIRYIRQAENIGSDRNFVFCFHEARGQYLLLLSDDDLIGTGAIAFALGLIERAHPGVICLRAFGYDFDPKSEWPYVDEGSLQSLNPDEFLFQAGASITLISSCILRRTNFDPKQYVGSNLVQVPMVMEALVAGPNYVTRRYWIACKRNNSGGYDFFKIFVANLFEILSYFEQRIISLGGLRRFKRKLLLQFFPQYMFKALKSGNEPDSMRASLQAHFGNDLVFCLAYQPVFYLPNFISIVWLGTLAFIGRVLYGDGWRIFLFLLRRMFTVRVGKQK